ncbi:MAG TPA: DUF2914 domain-containing protein [Vicinamibacterales bacterium]|nr:DUF2914 domain-containing protein [Vicinamibacterales bacterium]
MPEAHELRSAIEAANQAAAGGDYVAAELKLREAAALQEAQLGPFHADLANTLNNLGVIYERADSPAEAELCYRRAYSIATTALEPGHPFVATSRKNLEDFCKARGRPFDRSAVPRDRVVPRKPVRRSPRPIILGTAGALGFALLVVFAFWMRSDSVEPSSTSQTPTPAHQQAAAPAAAPVAPQREPPPINTGANTTEPPDRHVSIARGSKSVAPPVGSSVARERRAPESSAPVIVTIAEARLCRRLSTRDWRCDQVSSPVRPGSLFFYTRVNVSNPTIIEHRWYRDDRLSQSVELRIQASPGSGYRTYSRRTVSAENAGNWRVEVRTKDGSVLHEERFVVR